MKNSYPSEVYINGEWRDQENATVSVFDRGFLFGDGIYDVIPLYDGKVFRLPDHLDRMQFGLNEVGIHYDVSQLNPIIDEAIARSPYSKSDAAVYIQVTRGTAPRAHAFPANTAPTVLLYVYPIDLSGFENKLATVIFSEDYRWHRCDIKSTSLMANVRANNEAKLQGANENLFVRNGLITEGTHTSVFFLKDQTLFTHPLDKHILPSITRKVVIEICREHGLFVEEVAIGINEIDDVEEAFLAGTTTQILAIGKLELEGKEFFLGEESGLVTKQIQAEFIKRTRFA